MRLEEEEEEEAETDGELEEDDEGSEGSRAVQSGGDSKRDKENCLSTTPTSK